MADPASPFEEKSAVRSPEQVHFLGFRFLCTDSAPAIGITLSDKAKQAVMTTIRELTPPNWGRSITSCMAGLTRYLNGWMAHYRLCGRLVEDKPENQPQADAAFWSSGVREGLPLRTAKPVDYFIEKACCFDNLGTAIFGHFDQQLVEGPRGSWRFQRKLLI